MYKEGDIIIQVSGLNIGQIYRIISVQKLNSNHNCTLDDNGKNFAFELLDGTDSWWDDRPEKYALPNKLITILYGTEEEK